ncbi:hypothetical protein BUALT_Bualt15G0139000 [Buddleja alternifolia]|uniref:ATPase AAA-type core domain-containing protein n=1 Tax=Buddleja alternifolia TaxID=168488 RepID=A0AAV6WKA2_9LAMI|nr:hypothetical protein BUALT_Bualt15G0139000 [Buddleja alternifolia]
MAKKAVLLSGPRGIGKTTSAKLVTHNLGFHPLEFNASDCRRKADCEIENGIKGRTSNSIKELVSHSPHQNKTVLIMHEVDSMSSGDRGGIADLIANIKISKIPIICICNDHNSQKLKSLVNHCLLLHYLKPTKEQMVKRLSQIAESERLVFKESHILMASINTFKSVPRVKIFPPSELLISYLPSMVGSCEWMREWIFAQENYINYRPSSANIDKKKEVIELNLRLCAAEPIGDGDIMDVQEKEKKEKEVRKLKELILLACAAESIGDGDIVDVQMRRYQQLLLSENISFASCITPAPLLYGQRTPLEEVIDVMSLVFYAFSDLLKFCYSFLDIRGEAVKEVVEFMHTYSISMEDFVTILEMSKFKGLPNPLDDTSAKAASRKAYSSQKARGLLKSASPEALIAGTRSADLSTLAIKTIHDKWVAAMVQVVEDTVAEGIAENEEENPSDTEEDQEPDNLFDTVKMVKTVCTDKFIVRKVAVNFNFGVSSILHSSGPPPDFPEKVFYLPPGAIPKPLGDVKLPPVVYNFALSGPAKDWLLKHFGN